MTRRLLVLLALALATVSCAILQPSDDRSDSRPTRAERPPGPQTPEDEPSLEDAPEAPEPGQTEWEILVAGEQSAVRIPVARAVSDPGLWRDIWRAVTANQTDPPAVPTVDFDRETAVVLILGERRTGGYSVGIAEIIERPREVEVVIAVSRPDPGAMVTQALTTPYSIAVVTIAGKEFVFSGDSIEAGFEGD